MGRYGPVRVRHRGRSGLQGTRLLRDGQVLGRVSLRPGMKTMERKLTEWLSEFAVLGEGLLHQR